MENSINKCCEKNCDELNIFTIGNIFGCEDINWKAVPDNILLNINEDQFLQKLFKITQEEWDDIYCYLKYKWCLFIESIEIYFRNEYITENLKKLKWAIYKLMVSYFSNNLESLIYYIKSMDFTNYKDNTTNQNIYSVNDEPQRRKMDDLNDFMGTKEKGNIRLQNASSDIRNSLNLNKIYDELANRPNLISKFFDNLRYIVQNAINPLIYHPNLFNVCSSKGKK